MHQLNNLFFLLRSLRGTRAKIWRGRTETPLFNCKIYANDLERLFRLLWEKHERGEKPDHVTELNVPTESIVKKYFC